MTKLSIRRLWTMYKKTVLLAQNAFYVGAQSTLKVLAYMLEHGDIEALHRTIESRGGRSESFRDMHHGNGGTETVRSPK